MFAEVVAGVDFGPGGDGAIALARALIAPGGRLTLAHVVLSDPRVFGAGSAAAVAGECELSRRLLEREGLLMALDDRRAGRSGAQQPALCSVPAASPARGLSFLARERGADLVVVGASRRGLVDRMVIGDDARALLRAAPCAVAIAPSSYAAGAAADTNGWDLDPIVIRVAEGSRMLRRQARRYARLAREAPRPVLVLRAGLGPRPDPASAPDPSAVDPGVTLSQRRRAGFRASR